MSLVLAKDHDSPEIGFGDAGMTMGLMPLGNGVARAKFFAGRRRLPLLFGQDQPHEMGTSSL